MSVRRWWDRLWSWLVGPPRRRRRGPPSPARDDGDEEQPAAAPPAPGQPAPPEHAVFAGAPRPGGPRTGWRPGPPADDADLAEQLEQAVGQVLDSLGIGARLLDRDHLLTIAVRLNERAAWEKGRGRFRLAEALCQRALDLGNKAATPDDPRLVEVLENYAALLHHAGRSREAAHLEARAAAIRAVGPEEGPPDLRIKK